MNAPVAFLDGSEVYSAAEGDAWAELLAIMDQLASLEGADRQRELVAFARSPFFSCAQLLMSPPYGPLAREAWLALKRELDADSPANAWARVSPGPGFKAICRALQINPAEPTAFYATFPFRIIRTAEDEAWIGAAVGCPRVWAREPTDWYPELDITDVILWNPRSGKTQLLGDAASQSALVLPNGVDQRLRLYADSRAFFRAWADRRSETMARRQTFKGHPVGEPRDGNLPGGLIIGDIRKIQLPLDVSVIEAGPGIDARQLQKAIFRQAALPRVQDMS